jgi:tRNA uridine 5-carboxymethylaminomethyl modification enzyme
MLPLSSGLCRTQEVYGMAGSGPYDVVVVGGGHAGSEAFGAACRVGARAALVVPRLADIAVQPCNPAVGGPGKGHLVREVVALGGLMGRITDSTGLQFRTLNKRKGPAVQSTRVQTASARYASEMAASLCGIGGGEILEDRALGITWESYGGRRRIAGITLEGLGSVIARTVVIAAGTFLRGLLFTGDRRTPGGRIGAGPAVRLAESLEEVGLPILRLKTGTCPRLDGTTIEYGALEPQPGEQPPPFFDPETRAPRLPQRVCYLTYTGERTHDIITRNLQRSALYSGAISGIGPRYCPSVETKIARFPEKERHQVFLEPEDTQGAVVYPSGLSTSLPEEVQREIVRSIPGLGRAEIVRYGYAVEYDAFQPRILKPSLEVDGVDGLYLAGQVIGTSGYEEAAALGLLAGANAALSVKSAAPIVLARDRAYAGVMVDDLTTRGVDEPYRMFTSRAEYRLALREDNADERLTDIGRAAGLVDSDRAERVRQMTREVERARKRLAGERLTPSRETNRRLRDLGLPEIGRPVTLVEMMRQRGMDLERLTRLAPWVGELPQKARTRLEVDVKYAAYLDKQQAAVDRLSRVEHVVIPAELDYSTVPGLRAEYAEKLARSRPSTLGQASRIPGITPAAIQILHIWCTRLARAPK